MQDCAPLARGSARGTDLRNGERNQTMDSFQVTKYAGAFLGTVFIMMTVGLLSEGIFYKPAPTKPGYIIKAEEAGAPAKAEKPAGPVQIAPLMASANPEHGKAIFKRCQACHTGVKGGPNKVGPDLWNVVGRPIAKHPGFSYSSGMKKFAEAHGHWTYQLLSEFITKPRKEVPGTAMGFAGLPKPQDRADLLSYLRTLNDNPPPLPKPEEKAAAAAPAAGEGSGAPAKAASANGPSKLDQALASASAEKGKQVFRICEACHDGTKGGPNKIGPNLWDIVGRPIASHPGFDY
jgi:cytochrome c